MSTAGMPLVTYANEKGIIVVWSSDIVLRQQLINKFLKDKAFFFSLRYC